MKKVTAIILVITMMMTMVSCGQSAQEEDEREMTGQKEVSRIARYNDELPDNYRWLTMRPRRLPSMNLYLGNRRRERISRFYGRI